MADAIVIGSGISGLTTAALLAKNGSKVLLVEQNPRPGGALRRFTRSGIPFDIGFHYSGGLGPGEILQVLWEHLGVWKKITPLPMHPDGYDYFKFNGSQTGVKCFFSYEKAQEQLISAFPDESAGITAYLAMIRAICRKIPFYNLDLPFATFLRDFFTTSDRSLIETIKSVTDNPELQAILAAPAMLHGVEPADVGLTVHASVAHSYYSGAWGVKGGGQAIADSFLEKLADFGVKVIAGQRVKQIIINNGQVDGITLSDGNIKAKKVIYTGHPAHLPGLVAPGSFRPAYCSRLKDLADTMSMFMVFGQLTDRNALPILNRANLCVLNPGFKLLQGQPQAGKNGTLLLTAPGRREGASSCDKAAQGVILLRPAGWGETSRFNNCRPRKSDPDYQKWKEDATSELLRRAAESFGDECLQIKPLAAGTPLTFRDELGSPRGGVYGVQHNLHQFVARARTRVAGLYLSGQGSLMTGILGASMAGIVTASEIMGLEDTWNRIRECH